METTEYDRLPGGRITDLPDDDKPREKAMAQGVASLSNAELIAIALGSGLPGKSAVELAREILGSCGGNLSALARMSIKEMVRKHKGVGPAKAVSLAAAIALGERCAVSAGSQGLPVIKESRDVYECVRGDMAHLPYEEFRILVLSRSNKVKAVETISRGGTAATVVDLKLLLKKAIDALAEGLILVHNHPSGNLVPSPQDDKLTERIKKGAESVDIKVIDHVIVSDEGWYSYLDSGRL